MTAVERAAALFRTEGAGVREAIRLANLAVRARRRGAAGRVRAAREIAEELAAARKRYAGGER